ncbi:MAG: hypothetical protein COB53_07640 [Elusimicrobia bacterium]|nr:MAG: hypothetical protein COB53_07640 [Elusimicrobiota bacterium]
MRFTQKLILAVISIAIISAAMALVATRNIISDALTEQLIERVKSTLPDGGVHIAGAIAAGNEGEILPHLQSLKNRLSATYAATLDMKGLVTSHTDVSLVGKKLAPETIKNIKRIQMDVRPLPTEETFLFAEEESSPVGEIIIGMPLDAVQETERIILNRFLAVLSVAAGFMVLLLTFILNRILSPIAFLSHAAEQIRLGEMGGQVVVSGNDEIGDLARSFNRMSQSLAQTTVSMENLDAVIEATDNALIATDESGKIDRVNAAACNLFNRERNSLLSKNISALFPVQSGIGAWELELELTLAQEDPVPVMVRARPIKNSAMVYAIYDLRDHIRREEERSVTSKLQSLGVLAGGIAHDFNNLLTTILACSSILSDSLAGTPAAEEAIDIQRAAENARRLTHQLLTFSKGGHPVKETLDIRTAIGEATRFALRGSNIRPAYVMAPDLWPVDADVGQIGEVIHNLVRNASQAMSNKGSITVGASNIRNHETSIEERRGEFVCISVHDKGPGISREARLKIFDPYFTTKSEGHGLGLSVCHSIIERHGGWFEINSELKSGTTFSFFLPRSENEPVIKKPPKPITQAINGRVLVMDDNVSIARVATRMLKDLGCRTDTAIDGAHALERIRHAAAMGEPYSLAVLDLTIPGGMGGQELAAILRKEHPNISLVASSGYSNDPVMAEPSGFGFDTTLPKPYSKDLLTRVIFDLLSG